MLVRLRRVAVHIVAIFIVIPVFQLQGNRSTLAVM
jgi:hypothetical protein